MRMRDSWQRCRGKFDPHGCERIVRPESSTMRIRLVALMLLARSLVLDVPRLAFAESSTGKATPAAKNADGSSFETKVRPLLRKYCVSCHGSTKPKAGVNLASLSNQASVARNRKVWRRAVEAVDSEVMPPEGKP